MLRSSGAKTRTLHVAHDDRSLGRDTASHGMHLRCTGHRTQTTTTTITTTTQRTRYRRGHLSQTISNTESPEQPKDALTVKGPSGRATVGHAWLRRGQRRYTVARPAQHWSRERNKKMAVHVCRGCWVVCGCVCARAAPLACWEAVVAAVVALRCSGRGGCVVVVVCKRRPRSASLRGF